MEQGSDAVCCMFCSQDIQNVLVNHAVSSPLAPFVVYDCPDFLVAQNMHGHINGLCDLYLAVTLATSLSSNQFSFLIRDLFNYFKMNSCWVYRELLKFFKTL